MAGDGVFGRQGRAAGGGGVAVGVIGGEPAADFVIEGPSAHGIGGLVNLFGIESPGLTSCLAIAKHVADLVRPK